MGMGRTYIVNPETDENAKLNGELLKSDKKTSHFGWSAFGLRQAWSVWENTDFQVGKSTYHIHRHDH